ncbi:hypothetical protein H0H92_006569 [Tricholoma furcatifolium]|nr:hypothetical protein H0H92_006569 [Tricholoma furcatifolium]
MSSDDQITWYQPNYGSTFGPGEKIPVAWKNSEYPCERSPTFFQLCFSNYVSAPQSRSEGSGSASTKCGDPVWPPITKQKNGTCTTFFDAPSVDQENTFDLRLTSKTGGVTSESPWFNIAPTSRHISAPDNTNEESPNLDSPDSSDDATSPRTVKNISVEPEQTFSPAVPMRSDTLPSHQVRTLLSVREAAPDVAPSPSASTIPSSNTSGLNVAAFAVPLALVLCIAVVAVGLAVRHYRKRVQKRAADIEKLTRFSSKNSLHKAPLEYPANAATPAHNSGPVPLFMPVDLDHDAVSEPETRRVMRRTVPVSASYTNVAEPSSSSAKLRASRSLTVSRDSMDFQRIVDGENEDRQVDSNVVITVTPEDGRVHN